MARGKRFLEEEIENIKVLLVAGKSLYRIARILERPIESLYHLRTQGKLDNQ